MPLTYSSPQPIGSVPSASTFSCTQVIISMPVDQPTRAGTVTYTYQGTDGSGRKIGPEFSVMVPLSQCLTDDPSGYGAAARTIKANAYLHVPLPAGGTVS